MSAAAITLPRSHASARFGAVSAAFLVLAAFMAAVAPLRLSIWSVFLFAGPHNWMEARYLLARTPVRWGMVRAFFVAAIAGVACLSLGWLLLSNRMLWHLLFLGWIWFLARLHDRMLEARLRPWLLLLAGAVCVAPAACDYAVVYAHPLMAFWFLDRQIRRSRPEWSSVWRWSMTAVPALAALVAWTNRFDITAPLELSLIAQAGHPAFVAVHAFLELAHYAIWIVALPLLGLAQSPWRWTAIPLIRHRDGWPRFVKFGLIAGAAGCLVLWVGFALDYTVTRELYFTLAIVHVLAEAPFLIRLRGA